VNAEIVEPIKLVLGSRRARTPALEEAMEEVASMYEWSRAPVIYAGVEIMRLNLRKKLIALSEKLNLPVVTSIEGKAVFPEDHPNFIGIYMGRAGDEAARQAVEGSDCALMLGHSSRMSARDCSPPG
jgi:TPP-dependent 2-oxoacid decarboxylase